jgi:ATP-binding cassette subfamily B protein
MYPFVKQSEIKDCAASCMSMIIKYYHGNVNINSIKDGLKTSKLGTNAYNIVEYASSIGFESRGFKIDKLDDLNLPLIAHVIKDNKFKHYVVIYEIHKKYLLVADPDDKIKKVKKVDFLKQWTNVVILFKQTEKLPFEKDVNLKKFTLSILKNNKKTFFELITLSVLITILAIINSYYLQNMIENINKPKEYIIYIFIIFLTINLFKIIINYFRNKILIYLNQNLDFTLLTQTYNNIISLPYRFFQNRTTGEVVTRLNDISVVKKTISEAFVTIFIDLVLSLSSLFILLLISDKLTILVLIILLCYVLLIFLFHTLFKDKIKNIQINKAKTSSYMYESILGYKTLKSLNLEDTTKYKFNLKFMKLLNNTYHYESLHNVQSFIKDLIGDIGFLLIILCGILLIGENEITLGNLITFNMLYSFFITPVKNILDFSLGVNESKSSLKRVLELMYESDKLYLDLIVQGNIKFNNLTFMYDSKQVLKNLSLELKEKENVVLIGKSGSGKSTLFKLLVKFYEVKRNEILIDNNDINDYNPISLRQNITYISQDEIIFTDSLYNNIVLNEKVGDQEFLKVVKTCRIDEFIDSLGYNLFLEENGSNLSGGEKQRIFIARSLLKNSKYIIIDEAMSQMDVKLEKNIIGDIMKNYNKTIIMITHRLDNINLFDRKITLDQGKIISDTALL